MPTHIPILYIQEVPHDLRDDIRLAAGGGVRGQLQEELLHRVRDHRLQPDCQGQTKPCRLKIGTF